MSSYQYTPIDSHELQIRVLHILPRSHRATCYTPQLDGLSDQGYSESSHHDSRGSYKFTTLDTLVTKIAVVSCTLHVVSLKDNPEYHALSYCWGDPDLSRAKILLDETEIEVTTSLEQALRTFRHESIPMVFWADAICINQTDPDDKAEQIKLMRDIYTCASFLDVFLGGGTTETDEAMDSTLTIGQAAFDARIFSVTVDSMRDCEFYIREDHEGYGFNRPKLDDPLADLKRSLYELAMDIGFNFPYLGWYEIGKRDY